MRQSNKLVIGLLAFQLSVVTVKCNLSSLIKDSSGSSLKNSDNLVRPSISLDLKQFEGFNADAHIKAIAQMVEKIGETARKDHFAAEQTAKSDETNNKKSLFAQVGEYARRFIAPADYYIDIARRYRNWYRRYNLLQQKVTRNGTPVLRDAIDTLKIEYAKVDQKLIKESCALPVGPDSEKAADPVDESQVENVDHVLRALGLLIDELERKLDELEQSDGLTIEIGADSEAAKEEQAALDEINKMEQETSVRLAMDRAKRIVKKQAQQIAVREIRSFTSIALVQLAAYLVKNSLPEDEQILRPILLIYAGPTAWKAPLRYLNDVRFRATIGFINYSIAAINCQINMTASI